MNTPTRKTQIVRKAGILGVGLDGDDGHTRITRGDNFLLLGGTQATHEILQAKMVQINQELERLGKTIEDVTEAELDHIAKQLE
jgi:hypothetical protein